MESRRNKMKKLSGTKMLTTIIALFFLIGFSALLTAAQTIKIGTIVPLRSPWVKELKKLDLEWRRITNGEVKLKIYAGGIAGDEEDMVRKIRMGVLGGAVFTNRGITHIQSDFYVLNIPFLLKSDKELDYIMAKMTPGIEESIEKKGFKVVIWAKAGWIYFFTKDPVLYPKDLKKHKLSFTTGAPEMEQAWKKSGYHIIPNELKDMMMALQSGMVNAFYLPPLMAASGQYFPFAPNMCSIKIAPLVGGVVISSRIWKRIPDNYKPEMLKVAQTMSDTLLSKTMKLEEEAIVEMKKHKFKINQVPKDAYPLWKAASDKGMDALIGKSFSKEIYETMLKHIEEFRNTNESK